jgi:hypothetical protein
MKAQWLIVGLITLAASLYAGIGGYYDVSKVPKLSLAQAYERATTFLGEATNRCHCVSASVSNDNFEEGEWDFLFIFPSPANGTPRQLGFAVYFNGVVNTNISAIR